MDTLQVLACPPSGCLLSEIGVYCLHAAVYLSKCRNVLEVSGQLSELPHLTVRLIEELPSQGRQTNKHEEVLPGGRGLAS